MSISIMRFVDASVRLALLAGTAWCSTTADAQLMRLDRAYAPQFVLQHPTIAGLKVRSLRNGQYVLAGDIDFAGTAERALIVQTSQDGVPDLAFRFQPPDFLGVSGSFPMLAAPVETADGLLIAIRRRYVLDPWRPVWAPHLQILVLDQTGSVRVDLGGNFLGEDLRLTPTSDGRCLVWGPFQESARERAPILRINTDGSWDSDFAPTFADGHAAIASVAPTPNGGAVVLYAPTAGDPSFGYDSYHLVRIDASGSRDASFAPAQIPSRVLAVDHVQRVLVAGSPLLRLNADGSVDTHFSPVLGEMIAVSSAFASESGRILVGGQDASGRAIAAILSEDGALVSDLRAILGETHAIEVLDVDPENVALVRHMPANANSSFARRLIGFNRIDMATLQSTAWTPSVSARGSVQSLTPITGDRFMATGAFDHVNGLLCPGVARLRHDGTVDESYVATELPEYSAIAAIAPDGRVYWRISETESGANESRLLRSLANGELDSGFRAESDLARTDGTIVGFDPDGSILAVRTSWSPTLADSLAEFIRFNDDGTVAETWPMADRESSSWWIRHVYELVRDTSGRVYVECEKATLTSRGYTVIRFLPGGRRDPAYSPDFHSMTNVSIELLNDGGVLAHGLRAMTAVRPAAWDVVRLQPEDGKVDSLWRTFAEDLPEASWPMIHQADGTFISHLQRTGAVGRWTQDGALDCAWESLDWSGFSGALTQPDGKVYLALQRASFNGLHCSGLVRIVPEFSQGILVQPTSQAVDNAQTVRFQVGLGDRETASYQWQHDGIDIAGATGARLILENVSRDDAGSYRVIVSVGNNTYESNPATLVVLPRRSRIVNFSGRSHVSEARAPQIGGFVLAGNGDGHSILLRSIGGGLSAVLPMSSLLQETSLSLFEGNRLVATDTGNALSETIVSVANQVGAFSPAVWSPTPGIWTNGDSGLLVHATGGVFTAQTRTTGVSRLPNLRPEGIALFEFYDASEIAETNFVGNVSLRGRAGTGNRAMIGGIVVQGTGPMELLIRVVGPELAQFGVQDTEDDPSATLYYQQDRIAIAYNNDWCEQDREWIASAGREAAAFPLFEGSLSSAMRAVLQPGAYTVVVGKGIASTTGEEGGEVILEFYVIGD